MEEDRSEQYLHTWIHPRDLLTDGPGGIEISLLFTYPFKDGPVLLYKTKLGLVIKPSDE